MRYTLVLFHLQMLRPVCVHLRSTLHEVLLLLVEDLMYSKKENPHTNAFCHCRISWHYSWGWPRRLDFNAWLQALASSATTDPPGARVHRPSSNVNPKNQAYGSSSTTDTTPLTNKDLPRSPTKYHRDFNNPNHPTETTHRPEKRHPAETWHRFEK